MCEMGEMWAYHYNCTLDSMTREATDGWGAQKPAQAPLSNQ